MPRLAYIFAISLVANASAATAPKTLHAFGVGSQLGGSSLYGSLILDASGSLYGTAEFGGVYKDGVVFRLSRNGNGGWTETVLHSFKGGSVDGETPHDAVTMDGFGNLYGTTIGGGNGKCSGGCGVVFELTPTTTGPWTETVLHQFAGATDGANPYSGVILDAAGNVYGATTAGGTNGDGTVCKLSPAGAGVWDETLLYSFKGTPDGSAA